MFFASKTPRTELLKPVLLVLDRITHRRSTAETVQSLAQLHGLDLRAEEGDLTRLANGARYVIDDAMAVRLVLAEDEGCSILAALEVRIQSATALLNARAERLEAHRGRLLHG